MEENGRKQRKSAQSARPITRVTVNGQDSGGGEKPGVGPEHTDS